jgi:hypothetical protein
MTQVPQDLRDPSVRLITMHLTSRIVFRRLVLALALSASSAQAGNGPTLVHGGGTETGGMLSVDARGADYLLPGGARLHAAPGSKLRVFPRSQKLELLPRQKIPTYSVILDAGRVDVEMPADASAPTAVLISTSKDGGGIAMKGHFTALASRNRVAHANRDGQVLVKVGEGWKPLAAGFVQTLSFGGEPRVLPLLSAPRISGRFLRLAFGGQSTRVDDVNWQRVEGAASYEIELTGAAGPTVARATGNQLPHAWRSLVPGTYSVRVRAVDADGLEGRAWAAAQLDIVSVEVPPGSLFSHAGTVYLAPGAQVALSHANGLQMSVNDSGFYGSAAPSVGLYRGEPTTVVLRRPSDNQSARLVLQPRAVEADIVLGPTTAVWPKDVIDIDVRVHGPKGAALDAIEPRAHVTLGVDELQVAWTRRGHRMHARVRPRNGAGPWVLRVEVTDQHGILLGRNFVEIAQDPRLSRNER